MKLQSTHIPSFLPHLDGPSIGVYDLQGRSGGDMRLQQFDAEASEDHSENEILYTLKNAVESEISSSEHMTTLIVAQMLPGWRNELDNHEIFNKTVWANGQFKNVRALPRPIALQTIRLMKENALARVQENALARVRQNVEQGLLPPDEVTSLVREFQMINEALNGELEQGNDDE